MKTIVPEWESVHVDIISRVFEDISKERSCSDDITDLAVRLTTALVLLFFKSANSFSWALGWSEWTNRMTFNLSDPSPDIFFLQLLKKTYLWNIIFIDEKLNGKYGCGFRTWTRFWYLWKGTPFNATSMWCLSQCICKKGFSISYRGRTFATYD